MQFFNRSRTSPARLGVLAGAFNPPTIAHLALAESAGDYVDQVLYVVPRVYPHKEYSGATLEQRVAMLEAMNSGSVAVTEQGLLIDIARECRAEFGPATRLSFLCGRDAAERVLHWDYGRAGVVEEMLREFELLVAARGGEFIPSPEFRERIHLMEIAGDHNHVSSTEVRERIAQGKPWQHLVPGSIVEQVKKIYS
ncbi:MAG TPA: nicotinate-nicotinamide nucleotide adenylyltransferase [Bryobacteraceae bacterium]|nr:nicotinate-nicotinamide nucleotide adenylyltransferase [Bryobacteraceae bacterium]